MAQVLDAFRTTCNHSRTAKKDVSYSLDGRIRAEIIYAREIITSYLPNTEIYLFGSIAKGCYSNKSDIDLLVLLPEKLETKELRRIRHTLEDLLEEKIDTAVDLKLYTKERYIDLTETPCFEQAIVKDLVNIEEW